ncbi:MAG: histidinol-phosphate transaminase [Opitutales bacterium]
MTTESPTSPLELARPSVAAMAAYTPGTQPTEDGWIKLNTNENPVPPSERVAAAIESTLCDPKRLRRYPNPRSTYLRGAIARHHGLEPEQVLAGNGCDDILNLLMRCFAGEGRRAAMLAPSYSLYGTLASIQGAELQKVPLDAAITLPVNACAATDANLFFLTNPNAPTGVSFPVEAVRELVHALPGILVVDETYAPFAPRDCLPLLAESPRVVIARSFSKAYSLAGLRVGYALANPEVIDLLDRVRDSYNLDVLAQVAAQAAIEDEAWLRQMRTQNLVTREEMAQFYRDELGWHVYPSAANFHFVRPARADGTHGPETAADCFSHLNARKILVRYFPREAFTASYLRISLGTSAEMATVRDGLRAWRG